MTHLFIPVILGTNRKGCQSKPVAQFIVEQVQTWQGITTELIEIGHLNIAIDDAGEAIKNPAFAATIDRADGLIIVAPEYNHAYPGLLKHVLDTNLSEYIHKAVGLCGVSSGPFGGTRVIQSLLPVMRELGLMTIFYDLNFANVTQLFDESGLLLDPIPHQRRFKRFLQELVWMATVLQYGRQNVRLEEPEASEHTPMLHAQKPCPSLATQMGTEPIDAVLALPMDAPASTSPIA